MENKQKNSKKRLNSLILLVAFTAVMLIVSTYAWFSAQKNVTISNLEGKVNVAEGLMVSLDAKNWTQEIDFSDYKVAGQIGQYAANTDGVQLKSIVHDEANGLYVTNNIPTELIPVSTTGTEYSEWVLKGTDGSKTGSGHQEIDFYAGVNVEGTELYGITKIDRDETVATETDYPGYYAIDIFLQNSSKIDTENSEVQGTTRETLQLNTNSLLSLVASGSELTGLQNTARVALAMYKPASTADATSAASTVTSSYYVTANQTQILNAYKSSTIEQVAIWEPNANQHVDTIVTTNNRIKLTKNSKVDTLYIANAADENKDNVAAFTATEILPTFALTADSLTASETLTDTTKSGIKDVYDWQTSGDTTLGVTGSSNGKLKRQIALQTTKSASSYTTINKGVRNLIVSGAAAGSGITASTGEAIYEMGDANTAGANETGAVEFQMLKNTIVKLRMYIWLEGQDPDCINYASHGSGVHIDLGLVKGQEVGDGASGS